MMSFDMVHSLAAWWPVMVLSAVVTYALTEFGSTGRISFSHDFLKQSAALFSVALAGFVLEIAALGVIGSIG